MPPKASLIKESCPIVTPKQWAGTYSYGDTINDFSGRAGHNPWTWWAAGNNRELYPHLTAYLNDFNGDNLKSFHLTFNFRGGGSTVASPVHVHFVIKGQVAVFRANNPIDAARAQSGAEAAVAYALLNQKDLELLATNLVMGVMC